MHDFAAAAFDLADRYRNPVMILADGRLGQMMEPLVLHEGTHTPPDKPWALTGAKGRARNIVRSYYSVDGVLERHNLHIQEKLREIERQEVRHEDWLLDDAEIVLTGYGTCARLCREVVRQCRAEGVRAGLLRPISLWPFPTEAYRRRLAQARLILVIEMNAGQMVEDVRLAADGRVPVHFYGRMGGGVPTTAQIRERLRGLL
jgi:2-oxoglutarate/2-oxoacid ferredoxin oxidoreductase subunit alpha